MSHGEFTTHPAEFVGLWIDVSSGVLFFVLGCAVLFIRPRSRATVFLAAFCLVFGFFVATDNFVNLRLVPEGIGFLLGIAAAVAMTLLLCIGALFPARMQGGSRLAWVLGAVVVAVGAILAWLDLSDGIPVTGGMSNFSDVTGFIVRAGVGIFLIIQALRFRDATSSGDTRLQRQAIFLTLAFVPYFALRASVDLGYVLQGATPFFDLGLERLAVQPWADRLLFFAFAPMIAVVVCGMIVANARRAAAPLRRLAWTVAGLSTVLMIPGVFAILLVGEPFGRTNNLGVMGAARAFAVFMLAYAILKQQLFDIDAKIKRGISRTAVATLILAAVLLVGQLAQNVLNENLGVIAGAVAAGLLLLVISPLQRVAERLSDKAMPGVRVEDAAYLLAKKRETYRNAYAAAWADGSLRPKDIHLLAEFKEALDLPHAEYTRIEKEWAQQVQVADLPNRARTRPRKDVKA